MQNFKIIENQIYKISNHDLARRMSFNDAKAIICRTLKNGKIIIFMYTFDEKGKILEDGTFVRWFVILRVWYSVIKQRARFLLYNPLENSLKYCNKLKNEKIYGETKAFPLDALPDSFFDKIAEKIFEIESKQEEFSGRIKREEFLS